MRFWERDLGRGKGGRAKETEETLFIQQIFNEGLLHTRHCSRAGDTEQVEIDKVLASMELIFYRRETIN